MQQWSSLGGASDLASVGRALRVMNVVCLGGSWERTKPYRVSSCAMYLGAVCVREWMYEYIPIALVFDNIVSQACDEGLVEALCLPNSLGVIPSVF